MLTIITDEAGHEAARMACASTAVVTEMESAGLAALVVNHGEFDPFYRNDLEDSFTTLLRELFPKDPAPSIIFLVGEQKIEEVDEASMRRAGWMRVPKRRS